MNQDDITDDDGKLIEDYRMYCDNVMACYAALVVGDKEKARDLLAFTTGMALGFAHRCGIFPNSESDEHEV